MAYPGNPELSSEAQERVIAAFRQAINKLQQGQRQEALLGLEFVLRMDPVFAPATNLHDQLASGAAEIDLVAVISNLQAPSTDAVNELLVEAVEAYNNRDFVEARDKVKKVLLDLPGHREARGLLAQIEDALKVETQVGQFLTRAREALDLRDPEEAANFVMMAQALDPHAAGIDSMLAEINTGGQHPSPVVAAPAAQAPAEEPAAFETMAFNPAVVADFSFAPEPVPELDFVLPVNLAAVQPAAPPTAPPPAPTIEEFAFEPASFAPNYDEGVVAFDSDPAPATAVADDGDFSFEPLAAADDHPVADAFAAGADEIGFGFEPTDVSLDAAAPDDGFSFAAIEPEPMVPVADDGFSFAAGDAFDSAPAGPLFGGDGGDVADLFDSSAAGFGAAAASTSVDTEALIRDGQAAYDRGDLHAAVDTWSKVYAIDPNDPSVGDLIDGARAQLADTEEQVALMLADASDAEAAGSSALALELANAVLALDPGRPEAVDMKRRLAPGSAEDAIAAPGEGAPSGFGTVLPTLDDVEEDLFDDVPGAPDANLDELPDITLTIPESPKKSKKKEATKGLGGIRVRLAAIVAAALVVIGLGAWLGHKFLSGAAEDEQAERLNQAIEQAELLFQQRKVEEAIHLLQEFPASELDRERIRRKVESYQQALIPPTPTPIPAALTEAQSLVAQGLWMAAYAKVEAGLEAHPQDLGLVELKERISDLDSDLTPLHNALKKKDFTTASGLARDLASRHPDRPEFGSAYARCLFNGALTKLRTYNLNGAHADLTRLLQEVPDDDEAKRVAEFVGRYRSRPVDMQLEIYIASLKDR